MPEKDGYSYVEVEFVPRCGACAYSRADVQRMPCADCTVYWWDGQTNRSYFKPEEEN